MKKDISVKKSFQSNFLRQPKLMGLKVYFTVVDPVFFLFFTSVYTDTTNCTSNPISSQPNSDYNKHFPFRPIYI